MSLLRHFLRSRAACGLLVCTAALGAAAQTAKMNDLHTFGGTTDGALPYAPLMQASDGNFYGLTSADGPDGAGTIFRYTPGGAFKLLHAFNGSTEGSVANSPAGLIEGPDGNLYGVTAAGGVNGYGAFFQINLAKGTFKLIHSFGAESYSPSLLTLGSDGKFYVATEYGGSGSNGSILQITTTGTVTDLYDFPGSDLSTPDGPLVETAPLSFYGSALGSPSHNGAIYQAVVSEEAAKVTTAAEFSGANGAGPAGPLVAVSNGTLYGSTVSGGTGPDGGVGTIFTFAPKTDALTKLYDFETSPTTTGIYPDALMLGSDGSFYVPTGTSSAFDCYGSINHITPSGSLTTVYNGSTTADRCANVLACPAAGLVQGADGNYYGSSQQGGDANNFGDIYQLVPATAQKPPVQLTASTSTPTYGMPFSLSYTVSNAFSLTAQQCYAFVQGNAIGAGTWTGKQTGNISASGFFGSATITPTAAGTYTYALTCAGTESGFITLTVGAPRASASVSVTQISATYPGSPVTVGVEVQGNNSTAAPTGTVTVASSGTTLATITLTPGSGAVSSGSVTFNDTLPPGTYPLSLTYSGDTSYTSASSGASLTIQGYPSATYAYLPSYVHAGDAVSGWFQVTGKYGIPTGTIVLSANGVTLTRASLQASEIFPNTAVAAVHITTPASTYLSIPITATYVPAQGSQYAGSSSGGQNVTLMQNAAATDPELLVYPSGGGMAVGYNSNPNLSGVVNSPQVTSHTCAGSVIYAIGAEFLGQTGMNNICTSYFGVATTTAAPATYTLTMQYSGDAVAGAAGASTNVKVEPMNAYANPNPVTPGQNITVTAQIAPGYYNAASPGTVSVGATDGLGDFLPLVQNVPVNSAGYASTSLSTADFGKGNVPTGLEVEYFPAGASEPTETFSFTLSYTSSSTATAPRKHGGTTAQVSPHP